MKRFLFAILSAALLADAPAAEVRGRASQAKRTACQLFIEGKANLAVAHVRSHAPVSGDAQSSMFGVVQELIGISGTLYNQSRIKAARSAALEAISAAESLTKGRNNLSPLKLQELYSSLGVLSETVLCDLVTAHAYYDAAAQVAAPGSLLKRRREAAQLKKQRTGKVGGE